MNRHQRRADAARDRKGADRAKHVRLALDYLAHAAASTATGCTLFLPDGGTAYVSAKNARALHGKGEPGGWA